MQAASTVELLRLQKASLLDQLRASEHAVRAEQDRLSMMEDLEATVSTTEEYQQAFSSALAASEARIAALLNEELNSPGRERRSSFSPRRSLSPGRA